MKIEHWLKVSDYPLVDGFYQLEEEHKTHPLMWLSQSPDALFNLQEGGVFVAFLPTPTKPGCQTPVFEAGLYIGFHRWMFGCDGTVKSVNKIIKNINLQALVEGAEMNPAFWYDPVI